MKLNHTHRPCGGAKENTLLISILMAALVVSILLCMHDHANYERYMNSPESQMTGQQMLDAYEQSQAQRAASVN